MPRAELKPCPFCGAAARQYEGPMDAYGVVCTKCGVKLYGRNSAAAAKRAWNKRAKIDKWIPVSSELPTENIKAWVTDCVNLAICTFIAKPHAGCVFASKNNFCVKDRDGDMVPYRGFRPTHWMQYEEPALPLGSEDVPF